MKKIFSKIFMCVCVAGMLGSCTASKFHSVGGNAAVSDMPNKLVHMMFGPLVKGAHVETQYNSEGEVEGYVAYITGAFLRRDFVKKIAFFDSNKNLIKVINRNDSSINDESKNLLRKIR